SIPEHNFIYEAPTDHYKTKPLDNRIPLEEEEANDASREGRTDEPKAFFTLRSALRRHATKLEKGEDLSANIANEDNDAFRTNEDKEISRSMFVYDKIETRNGGFDVIFDSG
ncbi:MAG: hypothetical protein ACREBR_02250, partial [bacterium]